MSHRFLVPIFLFLVVSFVVFQSNRGFEGHTNLYFPNTGVYSDTAPQNADLTLPRDALYAPGTDPAYVAQIEELLHSGEDRHNFRRHWSVGLTANNTGGSGTGDSLVLTWSIVPDGTVIPGGSNGAGEPACNSNLISVMNARYGAGVWQAELQEVFDEWATLTGNTYIREANDDGAAWPTSGGAPGVRGDIRVSGCAIDGNSGILAYNFFPNSGDMKIDSTDSFFNSPQGALETGFHYVLSHEHGHGVGLFHVCPVNSTKLMEPFINSGFNTLRHDDIRGAQRGYGDPWELPGASNDSAATATEIGSLNEGPAHVFSPLSIDDNGDQDWVRFTVGADRQVDITVVPVGFTYEDGDQSSTTGQCQPGPAINSKTIHNLDFQILDGDGVTVLATGNSSSAGINEVLNDVYLGSAGVKYLRIFPATLTDDIQLYDLTITVEPARVSTLTVSPGVGRAGTVFTVQLTDFLPSTVVTISLNGQASGTVSTDGNGNAVFGFTSDNASDGRYYVRANDGQVERIGLFVVDGDAPLVGGNPATVFPIPTGSGFRALYLPTVAVNR